MDVPTKNVSIGIDPYPYDFMGSDETAKFLVYFHAYFTVEFMDIYPTIVEKDETKRTHNVAFCGNRLCVLSM
jgi:hypothetical protein